MATIQSASVAAPTPQLINATFTSPAVYSLMGMLSDRQTLLFNNASFSAAQLGVSTNGGSTVTWGKNFGGGPWIMSAVLETPGGEMLVAVQNRTGLPSGAASQLWRSTGWNKATADATSWTQVLTSSGAGVIFDGRWGVTQRSVAPSWSARPNALFVSEYGAHTNDAATTGQAAVRAWMSTDDGATWTQIFDLRDRGLPTTAGLHIHGIAYDPFDDRVFITSGDGGNADGGQAAVWYCDGDKLSAPVWNSIPAMQATSALTQVITVIPTASAVLFSPDSASLGIWRLPRRGYRRYGTASCVAQIGAGIVGAHGWQNRDAVGAPLFLTYYSSSISGPPSILVTNDGIAFTEAYRGPTNTSNSAPGIFGCVGPDINGKVYANYNLTGTGQILTADYQPNPAGSTATGVLATRQILAGPGLTGGGDLSGDRTLTAVNANAAAQSGLIAHTYPGHLSLNTTTALTSGTVYVAKVVAEDNAGSAARTVRFFQNTASSGLTLAKTAVFDANGNQLGVSSDQSTQLNSGGSSVRNISTGTFALTKGAAYYIALVVVGTTGPILTRTSNSGVANAGLSGASLLWATAGTGQTDMPATITPASLAAQATAMWFGVF